MYPILVVVLREGAEFSLQVVSILKKESIKVFAKDRSTTWLPITSFSEGMGSSCIGDALDFVDIKNAQIGLA